MNENFPVAPALKTFWKTEVGQKILLLENEIKNLMRIHSGSGYFELKLFNRNITAMIKLNFSNAFGEGTVLNSQYVSLSTETPHQLKFDELNEQKIYQKVLKNMKKMKKAIIPFDFADVAKLTKL